jgi:hypothetical protein
MARRMAARITMNMGVTISSVDRKFALPTPVPIEDNEMKGRRKTARSAVNKAEAGKEMKCRIALGLPVLLWASP